MFLVLKNKIKKKKYVVYIYNGILVIHKRERMPFAVIWMDLKIIILSKVRER